MDYGTVANVRAPVGDDGRINKRKDFFFSLPSAFDAVLRTNRETRQKESLPSPFAERNWDNDI